MRKLAFSAAAFSTAVIVSAYLYVPVLWPVIAGSAFACFLACFFIRKSICRYLRVFFLMFSLGLSFFCAYRFAAGRISESYSNENSFSAVVSDYPETGDNYSKINVVLTGKGFRCRAVLYDYYHKTDTLRPGDRISFEAGLRSVLDRDSSSSDNNLSKGIYLTGRVSSEITVEKQGYCLLHFAKHLNHKIIEMIPEVFPDDTVPFLKALLTGRKNDLYDDNAVYPVLLRSGFMHTVAISGMHISFIAGFCILVFGNDKKGSLISLIIIWLFIFMSGNTASAARAGIMQTILLFAPFVKRESDPLTSLSFALALLLLFNPFSAKSTGLQLSFAAVFGIILISYRSNNALISAVRTERMKRILRYPFGIISSSVGVMAFTIPLSAAHFGYVSILSIITNIFALWAIPVCFCGSYVCLALYLILPKLAVFLGQILAYLCRYVFYVCSLVSGLPHAVIPYEGIVTLILFALIYVLFLLFWFSEFSQFKKIVFSFAFSIILVLSYFTYFRISADRSGATVSVLDVGQGECVAAFSGNRAIVVDCGSTDYYVDTGIDCADYLYISGQKNVDALFLTHMHSDHVNGVCHLMELIPVSNVFIPVNIDYSDENYSRIKKTASRTGTNIILVDMDSAVGLGEFNVELYPSYIYTDSNESCMSIKVSAFGISFLIMGDGTYVNELLIAEKDSIGDIDVLVAGHHGSSGASCSYFLRKIEPEYSVISVGKNNLYGHPSSYTIDRMLSEGISVLRTDLCGRVTFVIK